jgi:uncharacterized membrane protein
MNAAPPATPPASNEPLPSVVLVANLVYALHTFAIVAGVIGTATVVGSFVGSIPSILAVILNYVKRPDVRGTYLESHFRWQIRTFWWAFLWFLIAIGLFMTIIGIPIAWLMFVAAGIWVLYRIVRGWLALNEERAMPA